MVRSIILLTMVAIFSGNTLYAKNGKKYKKEVLTLTKGKYVEVFDMDSIEQIGSMLLNVYTQKVVGFTNDEVIDTDKYLAADIISRRWNLEPLAAKYPGISPYSCFGNNPILYNDPLGADWFKDKDGNTTWHQATGKVGQEVSLKGLEGTWTNIGTEFIEFSGKQLTYSWQTLDESGNPTVNSLTFDAVSGKGNDPTSYWNATRIFDYSKSRQEQENLGPTPEGLYSINKAAFVPNQNESGTQKFSDQNSARQAAAPFGIGTWPGGKYSWGDYRWKLQAENAETYGRDNFYLHGGGLWGSRGCIDCGGGINAFYRAFTNTNSNSNGQVFIRVKYASDLKIEIQNRSTNLPLVNPKGQPIN